MKKNVLPLVMMLGIFVVAYALDVFIVWARHVGKETLDFQLLQWGMIGSYLMLAVVIVGVQYWLGNRKRGSRMMGYVFLAGGLLVLFAASPLVFVLFGRIPRLGQMTAQSGAFVALMGMLHLFTRRDK